MSEIDKTEKDVVGEKGENTESTFIETREYRLFAEFCDACCRYRYIGLCFGPPGVGKTLSANHYASHYANSLNSSTNPGKRHTVLYTAPVVNTPGIVEREIDARRRTLHNVVLEPLRRLEEAAFEAARQEEFQREKERKERLLQHDWLVGPVPELPRIGPTFGELSQEYDQKRLQIPDPTNLVLIDEADRLKMASLEATRAPYSTKAVSAWC
jgi:DNA transposition AAA+ family ATPase